jgi:formamidopyrimidine-DNA glycosylase
MPELPEVETIRRRLQNGSSENSSLIGDTIRDVQIFWDRSIATPLPDEFRRRIQGQQIRNISRRGKYMLFHLSEDVLLIHLRMSGDLVIRAAGQELAPHDRVVFDFESGERLAFNDTRKFGRVWLVNDPENIIGPLGPEPLSSHLTAEVLHKRLHDHARQLKPLLLDQTFLAGLGNIYADEALHLAHLHPLRRSDTLSMEESRRLWRSIRQVLGEGIRRSGASIDWVYRGGDFQNFFRAYGRTGEPCPECGTPIVRIVVGQRSTHYCPVCQPPPGTR